MLSGCVYPHPFTGMAYCVMQCVLYLYWDKCIHIGVGFEVVRFDMMGLPGPQFVKRATGKFTLSFCCVVNRLFHIKKYDYGTTKVII